jgi:nicotinamide mononucleotide transporter
MLSSLFEWFVVNWVEIAGASFGALYIYFSVKQHIVTWLMGLMTSVLYIYVFFTSGFYADMSLQFYYVWISIYGWVLWQKGKVAHGEKTKYPVTRSGKKLLLQLLVISLLLWIGIWVLLTRFTDSQVPIGDSFTTAMSIVATWMLARKKIEHWIVWIVVDLISIGLYIYKGLYPTTLLFVIYTVAAVWGLFEWRKDLEKEHDGALA